MWSHSEFGTDDNEPGLRTAVSLVRKHQDGHLLLFGGDLLYRLRRRNAGLGCGNFLACNAAEWLDSGQISPISRFVLRRQGNGPVSE